jgi:hypothetical protein
LLTYALARILGNPFDLATIVVSVSINGMSVPAESASQGWINQMIADANKRGAPLCIEVSVHVEGAQVKPDHSRLRFIWDWQQGAQRKGTKNC